LGLLSLFLVKKGEFGSRSKAYQKLEANVPNYVLPDPLISKNGTKIENKDQWEKIRRPEILQIFKNEVYGEPPPIPDSLYFKIKKIEDHQFKKIVEKKLITIYFENNNPDKIDFKINLMLYIPKKLPTTNENSESKFSVFLGLNFKGNDKISKFRWPIPLIIKENFAVATAFYQDIVPDNRNGLKNSVYSYLKSIGYNVPPIEKQGAISGWAWGLSRILDYFENEPRIDNKKCIILGHSRLGKTALWAGALDQRFSAVISNNSGCMGAAISRRKLGETVYLINKIFPHWFCKKFKQYNDNEDNLPIDQHMLLSLIAPRPLYVASASKDLWADPLGEFIALKNAVKVYKLYYNEQLQNLSFPEKPQIQKPIINILSYHIRKGKHDLTPYDWKQYICFAKNFVLKKI